MTLPRAPHPGPSASLGRERNQTGLVDRSTLLKETFFSKKKLEAQPGSSIVHRGLAYLHETLTRFAVQHWGICVCLMARNFYHQILKHKILKGAMGVGEMAQWLASTCCSSRELRFGSQPPQDDPQPRVTPVPGGPVFSSGLCGHQARTWFRLPQKAKHPMGKVQVRPQSSCFLLTG